jgi:hypothetical protein
MRVRAGRIGAGVAAGLLTAAALTIAGAAPASASAAAAPAGYIYPYADGTNTNNIATRGFAKTTGGVGLGYQCSRASGDTSNVRVQLVSLNQTVAYRDFPAICDGVYHDQGDLNAPSNTAMRARLHVYSNGRITGSVVASCYGYRV